MSRREAATYLEGERYKAASSYDAIGMRLLS